MPKAIGEYKFCAGCKKTKHISEFSVNRARADGLDYSCKECKNARTRKWKQKHKKEVSDYNKLYKSQHAKSVREYWDNYYRVSGYKEKRNAQNTKARTNFIEMYGGKCSCCGENRVEFLTLEHVHGQVGKRREVSYTAYRKAVAKYDPSKYDLLCMNCNFSRGKYGYCPHENEK